MLKAKLFLILLLTGARASENAAKNNTLKNDCVDQLVDGEKYFIKLQEADEKYSYVVGNRDEADKKSSVQLQTRVNDVLYGGLIFTPESMSLQEFTFQNDNLYAEMEATKMTYYVGLKQQSTFSFTDNNLYVAKDPKNLRGQNVVFKDNKLRIGTKGSETEIKHSSFLYPDGYSVKSNPTVCFVTKKTANRDFVKMVENYVRNHKEGGKTAIDTEFPELKKVMEVRLNSRVRSVKVPFSIEKFNTTQKDARRFFVGLRKQNDSLHLKENSDEIDKIINDSESKVSKEDLHHAHLMKFVPNMAETKEERAKENAKFDKESFSKLIGLNRKRFEEVIHQAEVNHSKSENNTLGVESFRDNFKDEGGIVEAEEEEKIAEALKNSVKKSVAVANTLAAILFFL